VPLGLFIALGVAAAPPADDVEKVAVAYLEALAGTGDPAARGYLLGGVPLAAREVSIPNWKIVVRDDVRAETGLSRELIFRLRALDDKARKSLVSSQKASAPGATSVDRDKARAMFTTTREESAAFAKDFPVFSAVARADKDVFWHPANPWRKLLVEIEKAKTYQVELHLFRIEEREGERAPRVWPLRVVRLTTDKGYDSGYKVLPASHWDPEY
jgi:crotonobetainyl-CoA:carnitine CoA-transferase CaiB-like acyl-CoA transferase